MTLLKKAAVFLTTLLIFILSSPLLAQGTTELQLRLRRDFGTSLGGRIAGTFSVSISNPPDDVVRVLFLLDGEPMGEDDTPPFRLQFQTAMFPVGVHTLTAVGYTQDGHQYTSTTIQREFAESSELNSVVIWIVAPLLLLTAVGSLIANWIANRNNTGTKVPTGILGSTVCPNCGKPFAIHIWSPHILGNRLDRCPHCKKWSRVTRASPQALQKAQEAIQSPPTITPPPPPPSNPKDDLRRKLDDSRFEN
ncbi:MAG: hypothetical protein Kow0080_11740 [Candidatus Promineifilaceae bacterium]